MKYTFCYRLDILGKKGIEQHSPFLCFVFYDLQNVFVMGQVWAATHIVILYLVNRNKSLLWISKIHKVQRYIWQFVDPHFKKKHNKEKDFALDYCSAVKAFERL